MWVPNSSSLTRAKRVVALVLVWACHSDNIGIVPKDTRDMAERVRAVIAAANLSATVGVRDADTLEVQSEDKLLRVDMINLRGPCARSEDDCNAALAKITTALTRPTKR